ncbi:hypothetical protein PTSG_03181 [Salpingoeca rosetta]|uniref:CAP-Gly domain-containing protein n=1 Tax=Salpingoeca rosetta (strain ATCC 50818 / BSB-021) TaxID=946362 RepID=F2U4G4_SALR5|nr:uncharacterized protein PTSG_03181 [Salpingoeca rosetta]EGD82530.1 hypothetical protein PTSG_03181 [Salpingoeca rosetta]|eukprot:XP_004995766.1 hypothetical protein PTSG_03181 [Salpingoeca rosetta]
MSLALERNEQVLQKCQVRHEGWLGTLHLTTKRLVFDPVDWQQNQLFHRISSVCSAKHRGSHLALRFFDGDPVSYEAAGPDDDPALETVFERLEQLRKLQYNRTDPKSKLEQRLATSNSALAAYLRSSERYQRPDAMAATHDRHNPQQQHQQQQQRGHDTSRSSLKEPFATRPQSRDGRDDGDGQHRHLRRQDSAQRRRRSTPSSTSSASPAAQLAALLTSGQHSQNLNPFADPYEEAEQQQQQQQQQQQHHQHQQLVEEPMAMMRADDMDRTASFASSTASGGMISWDTLFEGAEHSSHHHTRRQHGTDNGVHRDARTSAPYGDRQRQRGHRHADEDGDDDDNDTLYAGRGPYRHRNSAQGESYEQLHGDDETDDDSEVPYAGRAHADSQRSRGYSTDGSVGQAITTEQDARDAIANMEVRGPQSEEETATGIPLNARVTVKGRAGVLRYCGLVHFEAGEWAGIELDEAIGAHDGVMSGVRYFRCPENRGVFVPTSKVERARMLTYSQHYALGDPMILPRPEWQEDLHLLHLPMMQCLSDTVLLACNHRSNHAGWQPCILLM